jgi:hypothetical protein
MMVVLLLFVDRKGKGKELKVPHHASAAATRDNHVTTRDIVPTVNIYNYSRLVVKITNNLISLILSRVGYRDLGIYFSNNLSP